MVTAGTCEVDIPAQSGIAGLELELETLSLAINFKFSAGLTLTVTKDGFLCPFSGTGTKSGSWNGSLTVNAFDVLDEVLSWFIE